MKLLRRKRSGLAVLLSLVLSALLGAAEVGSIESGHEPMLSGKELDWIYGDYLMKNDQLSLVIAAPVASRDANMTIRKIGGSILDLTLNDPSNDQLSAFTPAGGRYLFHDPAEVTTGRDGDGVFWQCRSSRALANDGTTATVRYRLGDGDGFVESSVWVEGKNAKSLVAVDLVRADGWFSFEQQDGVAHCTDEFFRQTIGLKVPSSAKPPTWKRVGRAHQVRYLNGQVERNDSMVKWSVRLYPATSPIDLKTAVEQPNVATPMSTFTVAPKKRLKKIFQSVTRAEIVLQPIGVQEGETQRTYKLRTNDQGVAHARLRPGNYDAVVSAIGCDDLSVSFEVTSGGAALSFPLEDASGFEAVVTDGRGTSIPVKATIYSADGTHPNFGLSSTRTFVENCVYSVHGRFQCPLDPGKYEVHFSRGPEYNSVAKEIEVAAEEMTRLTVQLDHVVDTVGWVSADLHSHSSPSGDNTSDQYGRVENLLCEQIEFAPCTEHNRINSYSPHLKQMDLSHLMATCTGIELTGSPTPVNHQNAFPLHHHPHTQNGGGPKAASNPVVQIERLALWDKGSEKIVQMNHPNLAQIYGDLDDDGVPDRGFRGMLKWTDVVEVHPLETIFQDVANNPPSGRRTRIPLFHWMQLLNRGHRIPGVINTDSHYNHHGSGWRRNWIASSTDDPAGISTAEMVRQMESGHVVMSTGPFLSVLATSEQSGQRAIPGDELVTEDHNVTLEVSVQCPNWLDVNRLQIFINGRPSDEHNYTRKNSPDRFGGFDSVRKFESSLTIELDRDAHLIVATIGEGMTMERVMGRRYGKRPPIAVTNPIFVDVDGNGFQPNGDDLGLPLPEAAN